MSCIEPPWTVLNDFCNITVLIIRKLYRNVILASVNFREERSIC